MSEQPPVQPPNKPPRQPTNPSIQPPALPPAANPPTQPMPAAASAPPDGLPAGPPAGPPAAAAAYPPKATTWHQATSTTGGRWAIGISAGALALLLILGIFVTGLLVLRHHDRIDLVGNRQDGRSLDQGGPGKGLGNGNGNGKGLGDGRGPGANDGKDRRNLPGMPGLQGGRVHGLGGLGNLLGGTALHGDVTVNFNGSAQALVFQRGEVTAVSDTSITLKSSDGFVGTYGRTAATTSRGAAPVKGGQAFVLARASDKVAITLMATPAPAAAPSS